MRLGPNLRLLFLPIISIVFLVVLFIYLFQNGYHRFTQSYQKLRQSQQEEKFLEQKVSQLKEIPPGILEKSELSVIALPVTNPAIFSINNARTLASDKSVTIDKIEVSVPTSASGEEKKKKVEVKLEGSFADFQTLLDYLSELKNTLPVLRIEKFEAKNQEGTKQIEIALSMTYSPLPTKISDIREPIKTLEPSEQELLQKISSFRVPSFGVIEVAENPTRENPF